MRLLRCFYYVYLEDDWDVLLNKTTSHYSVANVIILRASQFQCCIASCLYLFLVKMYVGVYTVRKTYVHHGRERPFARDSLFT